jgi:adenylosuccinate lyase
VLLDEMLLKTNKVFTGLEVHSGNMLRNLESSQGLIMAEPVMMKLTEKGIGRQDAHEIVREASMAAIERGVNLIVTLMEKEAVRKVV